jgi:SAM-dependent methyltransferase
MAEYRWNVSEFAAGYDAAAEHIHPYYLEIQGVILQSLPFPRDAEFLLVDAGGGSGRLVERFLRQFPRARALIVDQSEAFLALAQQRLSAFGDRAVCRLARLQDDWTPDLPAAPAAIVSMSAIHHLDPGEKQDLYQRCHAVLAPGGVFLNGDEVRATDDAAYLAQVQAWASQMHRVMDAGLAPAIIHPALLGWEARNVGGFGTPRHSGDDCHEPVAAQLGYLRAGGFATVEVLWQKEMWAVMQGVK